MNKTDCRKLSPEALETLRRAALYLREREVDTTIQHIAEKLGVHRTTVSRWLKEFDLFGGVSSTPRKRGRKTGATQTITNAERTFILATIFSQIPSKAGLKGSLWAKEQIAELILFTYGIEVESDYIARLLRQCHFPRQAPKEFPTGASYKSLLTGECVDIEPLIRSKRNKVKPIVRFIDSKAIEATLKEKLLLGIRGLSLSKLENALNKPLAMLYAQDPSGRIQFRCYRAPLTPTARAAFLALIAPNEEHPAIIICQDPFKITPSSKKLLEKKKDFLTVVTVSNQSTKP